MRKLLAGVAAVAVLTTGAAVAQEPPSHEPDPAIVDGSAQRALDRAKKRWSAAKAVRYRFRIRTSCFCPTSVTAPRTYEVRKGRVVRPKGTPRSELATVPRLHRLVQGSIDDGDAQLDVRYDRRGVPRRIAIDGRRMIADDEISHTVERFERLRTRR